MTPLEDVTLEADRPTAKGAKPPLMRAARLHAMGEPLRVDLVPRPPLRPTDVVVQVKACGMVPNLKNILDNFGGRSMVSLPHFPAIFGLDAAGIVAEKGELVHGVEVGDRVYVNPARYCGACRRCRMGNERLCEYSTLNGYFGTGPKALQTFEDYPYGGYAEYMNAPQYSLVKIPDNLSFEMAARWGYLGTSYAALRRGEVGTSTTVFINGISGTLGLGAALFALALGAPKVLGVGRNAELLAKVKAIDPERIHVRTVEGGEPVTAWVRGLTDGEGADVVIDALPSLTSPEAFLIGLEALAVAGRHVNVGGVMDNVPILVAGLMIRSQAMIGSYWFSTAQGQEMADIAEAGGVNFDVFDHRVFALEDVNSAIVAMEARSGGFSNFVISPDVKPA